MKFSMSANETNNILNCVRENAETLSEIHDFGLTAEKIDEISSLQIPYDVNQYLVEHDLGYIYVDPTATGDNHSIEIILKDDVIVDVITMISTPIGIKVCKFIVSFVKFAKELYGDVKVLSKQLLDKWQSRANNESDAE